MGFLPYTRLYKNRQKHQRRSRYIKLLYTRRVRSRRRAPQMHGRPLHLRSEYRDGMSAATVDAVYSTTQRLCQSGLKNSNVENFKTPYLPQMGADSPRIKTVFLRAVRAITWSGQIGGVGPVRGRSPNCPNPPISRFFAFLTNFRRNDFRLFLKC